VPLQDVAQAATDPALAAQATEPRTELERMVHLLNEPFAQLGKTPISLSTVLFLVAVLVGVIFVSGLARRVMRDRLLARTPLDLGAREALSRIFSYVVGVIGLLIGFTAAGIDLSSLTVLLGALGVGIGFGLQNIVNNFVSGLIILVERPIQIGQRIDVGGTTGRIVRIGARSTTLVTNDNIAMVLPNSKFIEEPVTNWSLGGDRVVRFRLPVGVSYGSDPNRVREILLEVARQDPNVLQNRESAVIFKGFGDSSLDFELWVWTESLYDRPNQFKSPLYYAMWYALKKHGVEIPFPQRDLHVKGEVALRQG
jgi:small-conductance mechanosensitive channel